jgi:hypothetical protein
VQAALCVPAALAARLSGGQGAPGRAGGPGLAQPRVTQPATASTPALKVTAHLQVRRQGVQHRLLELGARVVKGHQAELVARAYDLALPYALHAAPRPASGRPQRARARARLPAWAGARRRVRAAEKHAPLSMALTCARHRPRMSVHSAQPGAGASCGGLRAQGAAPAGRRARGRRSARLQGTLRGTAGAARQRTDCSRASTGFTPAASAASFRSRSAATTYVQAAQSPRVVARMHSS